MSLIAFLISITLTGLFVGALGRLALPGRDPMSLGQTILIGISGSIAGGLLSWALFGRNGIAIPLSVGFATLIVYFIRRSRGGSITDPGRIPGD